jgi:hypothetical protein
MQKAFVGASKIQYMMRLRKLLANTLTFAADIADKSKHWWHGGDNKNVRVVWPPSLTFL